MNPPRVHLLSGIILSLVLGLLLAGCGPSETQLQSTATQIAANIYATLTAQVPTATRTLAPTQTAVPTRTPTPIPTPSATPTQVFDAMVNVSPLKAFSEPEIASTSLYEFSQQDGLVISGRNRDCSWIEVKTPFGDSAWVNTQLGRVTLITACEMLPHGYMRPENGAMIYDQRGSIGHGEITIENGLLQDGYVILTDDSKNPMIGAYIHSGNETLIKGIPDGDYWVYFSTGELWDMVDYGFVENVHFQRLLDMVTFSSTNTTYSIWTITLHPVEGGTTELEPLQPDEFPTIEQ